MHSIKRFIHNKVVTNAFYLMVLQVLNNVLPILTIPYLVRVLGASEYGVIAYSQVIFTYISVISEYGFNLSSTRLFAIHSTDNEKVNEIFNAVFFTKLIIMSLCLVVFTPFVFFTETLNTYKWVYIFSYFIVLGQVLFPVWFYQGMEDMRSMVKLNSLSKILFTILIFVFVKGNDQLNYIPLFNAAGSILTGVLGLYFACKKYKLVLKFPPIINMRNQLKDGFDVFIPSFFSNVISNGGVFILGMFHSVAIVGYFSAVDKLIRAGLNLFTPISQALFPNISRMLIENKSEGIKLIKRIGLIVCSIILIGVIAGFIIGPWLLDLILGPQYSSYSYVFNLLSVWFLLGVLNNFIGIQFLVGAGFGKTYRKVFLITGFAMLLMYVSIVYFAINGIVFSMLAGELMLTILMIYYIRKQKLLI